MKLARIILATLISVPILATGYCVPQSSGVRASPGAKSEPRQASPDLGTDEVQATAHNPTSQSADGHHNWNINVPIQVAGTGGAVILFLAALAVWGSRRCKHAEEALEPTILAIEDLPPDLAHIVKQAIAKTAASQTHLHKYVRWVERRKKKERVRDHG